MAKFSFRCPACNTVMLAMCNGQYLCSPCGSCWDREELLEAEAESMWQAEQARRDDDAFFGDVAAGRN